MQYMRHMLCGGTQQLGGRGVELPLPLKVREAAAAGALGSGEGVVVLRDGGQLKPVPDLVDRFRVRQLTGERPPGVGGCPFPGGLGLIVRSAQL